MDSSNLGYAYQLPTGGCMMKIRNVLSQFSDLFSEFNRYIAPAYHHDRCERSVQMRLYSMHKREFCMVFLAFFISLGLAIFIGLAGPPITSTTEQKASEILQQQNLSSSLLATGPFTLHTPTLSTYHQQLWVIAVVRTDNTDDESFDKVFQVGVLLSGIENKHEIAMLHSVHNRTRHLKCSKQTCEQVTILHLGFIDYAAYVATVFFYDLENFHQRYNIKDVVFYFKTYNPGFTQLELWFRLFYLLGTFCCAVWFAHTLRKFTIHDWSFEQKWISVLLPLLLLYNNPFFPMLLLFHSWLPGMFDALYQASFLCALLLFWLCVYHGLRQNERKLLTFYLPKILIVAPIWTSAVILATWEKVNAMKDPTYDHKFDTQNFESLKSFFYIFMGLYIFYLLCLILTAYSELRSMPFFDMRLKFLTMLMLIVIAIGISITFSRFGVDIVEDNFISDLSTTYESSVEFMALYGLLNFYLFTMAFVYSPSENTIFETAITKDNPAFSMINDSDEDVIYGSDLESRQPLNQSHNDDDSD
nr:PREDICTED: transmembrane protein 181 [Bemisia tabaci]XP_018915873.1 PREDICTED: transmembrane protein 181 [Bemisia tabaci]